MILLLFTITIQIFLYNKVELKINKKITSPYSSLLIFVFILFSAYDLNLLSQIDKPKTLAGLQDVEQIGLLTKFAVVILPAIAFTIYLSETNKLLKVSLLIGAFSISGYTSVMILSKMPLVPYVIFFIYMVRLGKISKIHILTFGLFLLPLLFSVYFIRGSSEDILEMANMIIKRLVMLNETTYIINWLYSHDILGLHNLKDYPRLITENVFGYDSATVGIAPSFLGFFLLIFGYIGLLPAFLFIYLVYVCIDILGFDSIFYRLFYFLWTLEILSFFTDGIPHFYLSTRDGRFFWFLVVITAFLFLIKIYNTSQLL